MTQRMTYARNPCSSAAEWRGPVVRGLRSRVDHELDGAPVPGEQAENAVAVTNVEVEVDIALSERLLDALPVPFRRRLGPEEHPAHVVVDPDDLEAEGAEVD